MLDREESSDSTPSSGGAIDETLIVSKESYDRKLADLDLLLKKKFLRIRKQSKRLGNWEILRKMLNIWQRMIKSLTCPSG